jgi:hypothetical protein
MATVIVKTHDKVAVIYGYNSDTSKYYGMFDSVQPNASIQTIASYHALPWVETCKGIELFDKDRVKITDNTKTGVEVLYPSLGFCKNNKKPDRALDFLGLSKRGFCFSLKLKNNKVDVIATNTNMSRSQIVVNDKEIRLEIIRRYQQHKAEILDFA